MTQPFEYALLSGDAYRDTRQFNKNNAPIPQGWIELTQYAISGSGPNAKFPGSGFSARVYRDVTGEIAIAYAGTQFGGSGAGQAGDWLAGNMPLAVGLLGPQAVVAAELYQRVAADLGNSNITFTGHSLGGGLAAMMAVYFDRPARVFAPAPFGKSADPTQYLLGALGPLAAIRAKLFANALLNPHLGGIPEALADYSPGGDYTARSAHVLAWAVKGEILEKTLFLLPFIETSGTRTSLFTAGETELGMTSKHSIDLHAAGLISPTFNKWASTLPGALPLIFDRTFYAVDLITGKEQDFLVKLNRNQIGVADTSPNAMLSHFANDLQKLGTNMVGLSRAAQDALTAQSIEWYFWQGNDYAGQEFFNQTGELLQYTSAQAAGLANVQNKAVNYIGKWLTAVTDENGAPVGNVTYDQWNVVAGSSGSTATAKDANKGQIFIGGAGGDTFTGGNKGDVFYASAGDDSLNGGAGDNANDWLYGGAGNDTYKFTGTFGSDVVIDSDGQGSIQVDDVTLQGGKKLDENSWYNKEQGFVFILLGSGDNKSLVIQKDSSLNYIRVQGWQNGQLGLTMEGTLAETPEVAHIFLGDQHGQTAIDTVTGAQYYDWASTSWTSEGVLTGGVIDAGYKDVITGSSGNDKIDGKGGNDLLYGGDGNDEIEGGDGDDLIGGGKGSDTIKGGAGNDTILSATNVAVPQRVGPTDTWDPTLAIHGGSTEMDDASDVIEAGDGNDIVYAGRGGDRIEGGAGNDKLWGLAGNDIIEGGTGDDELLGDGVNVQDGYGYVPGGSHGSDFLDGAEGSDTLWGFGKDDSLFGGAGNDILWGDASGATLAGEYHGNDYLDGEDGDDTLTGNGKDDTLYGGDGNDSLYGDADESDLAAQYHGDDYLDGEGGNDILFGDGGNDTLYGGEGNDELHGDALSGALAGQYHGDDYLDGEAGNDLLLGNGGNDTLYGGDGNDELQGDGKESDLAGQYHGDDYLDGEDGDDVLFGDGGNDTLYGGAGRDTLHGDAYESSLAGQYHGDDYLNGGAGNDLLIGDGGNDTLYGGDGDDEMQGDASEASLAGQYHGDDYLNGEAGNDTLYGLGGDDTLYGGDGNDIMLGDSVEADLSAEYHGNDYLDGGAGDDVMAGNGGDDTLLGGDGNDVLWGDTDEGTSGLDGDDILDGGAGMDTLHGGGGDDTLVVGTGDTAFGGSGDDVYEVSGNALLIDESGQNHYTIDAAQATSVSLFDVSRGGGTLEIVNAGGAGNAPVLTFLSNGNQVLSIGGLQVRGTGWADGSLASVTVYGQTYTAADLLRHSPTSRSVNVTGSNQNIVTGLGADDITVHEGGNTISAGGDNDRIQLDSGGNTLEFQSGDGRDLVQLGTGVLAAASAVTIALGEQANLAGLRIGLVQRNSRAVVLHLDSTGTDSITLEPDSGDGDVELFLANIVVTAGGQTTTLAGLLAAGQEIQGDAGDNYLMAFNKPSVLSGAAGNDVLVGSAFNDTLDGGTGDDILVGGAGDDTYVWGRGGGNDTVNEESGFNIVRLSNLSASEIVVRNDSGTLLIRVIDTNEWLRVSGGFSTEGSQAPVEKVVFANGVEWDMAVLQLKALQGSAGGDAVWGFDTNDTLEGGDGDDSLRGGGGDDRLIGGAGNDSLGGDSGSDTFVWGRGDGNDQVYDWGGSDDAVEFRGLNASDLTMVRYNGGEAVFRINDTGERLAITQNFYSLEESFYTVEWLRFADGTSWNIHDQSLNIELRESYSSESTLLGWSLADHIVGGAYENYLYGFDGDDILDGGGGNDQLYGGAGNDTYVWYAGSGDDVIRDASGEPGDTGGGFDTVKLTGLDPANIMVTYEPGNLDLIIRIISTGETLTVQQGLNPEAASYFLERIVFDNGVVWSAGDILALADASRLNHAPEVAYPLSDLEIEAQGNVGLDIPSDLFSDDDGNPLMYSLSLANGDPLPAWLNFNVESFRLEGTAPLGFAGALSIAVKARDVFGLAASSNFALTVATSDVIIQGTQGNDTLFGTSGADVMSGGAGNDVLMGGFGADTLFGGDGDDVLDGRAPAVGASATVYVENAATMKYVVDDGLVTGCTLTDAIVPSVAAGQQLRVHGGVSPVKVYVTPGSRLDGSELIAGGDSIHLSGNLADYSQAIDQDTGIYTFTRIAGLPEGQSESALVTVSNTDTSLYFADGYLVINCIADARLMDVDTYVFHPIQQSWLSGGPQSWPTSNPLLSQGADRLIGGLGDDLYFIDDAGDAVVENAEEGTDTVQSYLPGYTLGANVENLTLLGNGNINGTGNALANVLFGNAGNNILAGDHGGDTYQAYRGMGQDRIVENDAATGTVDVLSFGGEISANQLWMRRSGNDLEISIIGTADKATVQDWYLGSAHHVEQICLSDGKTLQDSDVEILVQAMAPYAPPVMGQMDLSAAYAAQLAPVIAASWH